MFDQDLLKLVLHRVSLQDFRTKRLLPIESFQACRTKNVTPTEPLGVFLPKYGLKRRVSFRVRGFHLVLIRYFCSWLVILRICYRMFGPNPKSKPGIMWRCQSSQYQVEQPSNRGKEGCRSGSFLTFSDLHIVERFVSDPFLSNSFCF